MAKDRTKANGEGTIYRRGQGYCGQYHLITRDGTKKRRSVYGKTRAEAAEKLAAAVADRDRGLAFDAGSLTLSEYLDRYLDDAKGRLRPKPFNRAEGLIRNHIKPALGRVKLGDLSPAHLRGAGQPVVASFGWEVPGDQCVGLYGSRTDGPVAYCFCVLHAEWCQQWCQMASAAPLLRWPYCTEDISEATPRPFTFQPYLGDGLRLQREANGRSLSVEGSSISLLDSSEFGSILGINCPNNSGNHPLPPGIVVPLE